MILRGTSGALLVQVCGAVLGLVAHLVVARALGGEGYSIYALTLTWISVLCVFTLAGQEISVIRFLPVYLHDAQWRQVRGLLRGTSMMVLVGSIVIGLSGSIVVGILHDGLNDLLAQCLLCGFLLLPIVAQLQLNGAVHRGLKRSISSSGFNSVVRPILFIVAVLGIIYGFDSRLTAPRALLLSAAAALAALVASSSLLRAVWPTAAVVAKPEYEFRRWISVGSQLFLIGAINITMIRVDILLLGALAGSEEVGPYFVAVQLAGIAGYGLQAVSTILAPLIAQHYAAGEYSLLAHLVHRASQLSFVITASISTGLVLLGHWLLSMFGDGFTAAYFPLLIILTGQCVNACLGPVGYMLTMTEFERQAPWFFGTGAALNIVLSLLLIPHLGMYGAAIAVAVSIVSCNTAAVLFVRRRLSINTTILPLAMR